MKKMCKEDHETLTKGKEYEAIRIEGCHCYDDDVYVIKDDTGKERRVLAEFF